MKRFVRNYATLSGEPQPISTDDTTLHVSPVLSLTFFFCIFRGDKRLAEGRGGVDEDAGGEPHPQGEDPAHAG